MKKLAILLLLILPVSLFKAQTNPGDTMVVQTFTFGSPQDAWFVFPSDTNRFEKVVMKYTLKCNPAQNPACGQWDYLTNTYLYKHTGLLDSNMIVQPTLSVNGTHPDSIRFNWNPTYSYSSHWQYFTVNTSTVSLTTATIGTGTTTASHPFGAAQPVSKAQYLWKASELTAAGLTAGNITGLQFYLQSLGGSMRNLSISMQHSILDSLTNAAFTATGFTNVYLQNTTFLSTGWNGLQLTTPFNWDGTSNILVEITYDNLSTASNNTVAADTTQNFKSALYSAHNDRAVSANPGGHINVPLNPSMAAIDSFITVSYWAYGDAALQPMDGTCFEAIDSLNQRVINAHMPWSDANVYWDAGNTGGNYDRINKAATVTEYEGKWNYWTFTKDVATGSMKIYLNGVQWHSGTGKTRRMKDIKTFRLLQGNWGGAQSYAGRMDEFMVMNKVLTPAEILNYMNNPINASDSNYNHLAVYFKFNDGNNLTVADSASGNHNAATLANVQNPLKPSSEITSGLTESHTRPQIKFEQGVYTSHLDSIQITDSTLNVPMEIVLYNDSVNQPGVATDTIMGWPVSSSTAADSTIYLSQYIYYNKFPQVIRYELGRYITPYGNGLSLGSGWTWTFDVSDYVKLLHDSVHLAAGNWQELLDVKFLMILGTPPRDVLDVQNLYNGNFNYGFSTDPIENHLPPLTINVPANAQNARWKSRVTGHGMDTPGNCAEFCPQNHYYYINNNLEYTKLAWRDNCDFNPLYPQGGTWVYDRSNWCPGAEVWTYDFELSPFVTPGSPAVLNHDIDPYTNTGGWDYWQIEDQVVYYSAPNFTLDAALEDIISPSTDQMYKRQNPICTNPIIRIRNTGSSNLTSLTITYGMNGATPSVYQWTGNLPFMSTTTVALGAFTWAQNATTFSVSISAPNGGTDQYAYNNTRSTPFTFPTVMPNKFVVEYKSNNNFWEETYQIKNSAGTVVLSGNSVAANTTYRDTLVLAPDCYTFELYDSGEDGLNFWANTSQGSGYIRFKSATGITVYKNFGADFGGGLFFQFNVGLNVGTEDYIFTDNNQLNVFPNPSNGQIMINVDLASREDGQIKITDVMGRQVYTYSFKSSTAESVETDLSSFGSGVYFVNLYTKSGCVSKRIVIQ